MYAHLNFVSFLHKIYYINNIHVIMLIFVGTSWECVTYLEVSMIYWLKIE